MPLVSKILFALSILAVIITALHQLLQWLKYKKELKAYQQIVHKMDANEARKIRLEKEAEVIRRFNEMQKEMDIGIQEEENQLNVK